MPRPGTTAALIGALAIALSAASFTPSAVEAGERAGAFRGLSNHVASGTVTVVEEGGRHYVVLAPDFSFDGAPDARIGFGGGGRFAKGTDFEPLRSNSGEQRYEVPEGIDPAQFDEVYVWCRQYAVPLGAADLK